MSVAEDEMLSIVYEAIEQVNKYTENEVNLDRTLDQPLYGGNGPLDSMDLVNLLITLEEMIEVRFGKNLQLMNSGFQKTENNPFETVQSLVSFLSKEV